MEDTLTGKLVDKKSLHSFASFLKEQMNKQTGLKW